jgi:hypothetical protein
VGRARRARRPGGSRGVHRAGPAAPLARLLPLPPVAVTAEPAVAGAVRQVARAAARQARGHADTGILGAGRVQAGHRRGDDAGDPVQGRRQRPAGRRRGAHDAPGRRTTVRLADGAGRGG